MIRNSLLNCSWKPTSLSPSFSAILTAFKRNIFFWCNNYSMITRAVSMWFWAVISPRASESRTVRLHSKIWSRDSTSPRFGFAQLEQKNIFLGLNSSLFCRLTKYTKLLRDLNLLNWHRKIFQRTFQGLFWNL